MKTFKVTISEVSGALYDDEAVSLAVPGVDGDMTVLAGHEALISPLKVGTATVETATGEKKKFPITGGVLEVSNNQATVLL